MKIERMIEMNRNKEYTINVMRSGAGYFVTILINPWRSDAFELLKQREEIQKIDPSYFMLESQREPIRMFKTLDAVFSFMKKAGVRNFEVTTN